MGSYNILNAEIHCQNCSKAFGIRLQFKFGDIWQKIYEIGDTVSWGGNDIGSSHYSKVKVYGIAESGMCPHCNFINKEEYDIYIEDNSIRHISPLFDLKDYLMDKDGDFHVFS